MSGLHALRIGSCDQRVLNRAGDEIRVDWGYFYLAVPDNQGATLVTADDAIRSFVASGELPHDDDLEMPRQPRNGAAHLAVVFKVTASAKGATSGHALLAYDEGYSVEDPGRKLRPYGRRDGQTVAAMLIESEKNFSSLEERGRRFDRDLATDMERVGVPHMRNWRRWHTGRHWLRMALQPTSTERRCSSQRRTSATAASRRSMFSIPLPRSFFSSTRRFWRHS